MYPKEVDIVIVSKKSQTATEYMIILAVVIIIALIAVAVLGGIPGVGAGAKKRGAETYWNVADVGVTSYANAVTGNDVLKVKNNKKNTITIDWVNMSTTSDSAATTSFNDTDTILGAGEVKTLTGLLVPTCTKVGDNWATYLTVKYQDVDTGAIFYFKGDGNKLEGVCASIVS